MQIVLHGNEYLMFRAGGRDLWNGLGCCPHPINPPQSHETAAACCLADESDDWLD